MTAIHKLRRNPTANVIEILDINGIDYTVSWGDLCRQIEDAVVMAVLEARPNCWMDEITTEDNNNVRLLFSDDHDERDPLLLVMGFKEACRRAAEPIFEEAQHMRCPFRGDDRSDLRDEWGNCL